MPFWGTVSEPISASKKEEIPPSTAAPNIEARPPETVDSSDRIKDEDVSSWRGVVRPIAAFINKEIQSLHCFSDPLVQAEQGLGILL